MWGRHHKLVLVAEEIFAVHPPLFLSTIPVRFPPTVPTGDAMAVDICICLLAAMTISIFQAYFWE